MNVWTVGFSGKADKQKKKLPDRERKTLDFLVADLEKSGPVQHEWPNYSKLGAKTYHCHLSYKWVACWMVENDKLKFIEIYYAGSRENAPY